MKIPPFLLCRSPLRVALISAAFAALVCPVHGQTLFWGPNQSGAPTGGAGVWDLTNTNWATDDLGTSYQAWPASPTTGIATFGSSAGVVTVADTVTIAVDRLRFNTSGYEITASGTGAIDDNGAALVFESIGGDSTTTISAPIVGTGDWQFEHDQDTVGGGPINTFVLDGINTRDGDLTVKTSVNDNSQTRNILQFNTNDALGPDGASGNTIILESKTQLLAGEDLTLQHQVNSSAATAGGLSAAANKTLTIDDSTLLVGTNRRFGGRVGEGTILWTDTTTAPTSGTTILNGGSAWTLEVPDAAALGGSGTSVEWEGLDQTLLVSGTSSYSGTLVLERGPGAGSLLEVATGITFTQTGDIVRQSGGNATGQVPVLRKTGEGTLFIDRATGITLAVGGTGTTGGISVEEGTLEVQNSSGSATGHGYVRIADGATLRARDGSIINPTNDNAGADDEIRIYGTLELGPGIASVTIGNSTDDNDSLFIAGNDGVTDFDGLLEIEFDGATSDFLDLYGTLTLDTGGDSILRLENFGLGAMDAQIYTIASYTTLNGTFDQIINNTGLTLDSSFGTGGIDYDYLGGSNIAISFVPEPSVGLLVLVGVGGLFLSHRVRPARR